MVWLSVLVLQEPWWDQAWQHRRAVRVRNTADRELPAGTLVVLRLDVEYLGIQGKSRGDLRDLRLVHRGKAVPLSQGREGRDVALMFPLPAPIPPAGVLALQLYYGSPDAEEPERLAQRVVRADFAVESEGEILESIGGAARVKVRDSHAILEGQAADSSWTIRGGLPADGFRLRLEGLAPSAGTSGYKIMLRPKAARLTKEDQEKARKLLSDLGSESYETREAATRELIRMGRPVVPLVRETLATTADLEVRWRCREILAAVESTVRSSVIEVSWEAIEQLPDVWSIRIVAGQEQGQGPNMVASKRQDLELVRGANGEIELTVSGVRRVKGKAAAGALELVIVVPGGGRLALAGLRLEPAGIERRAVSFEIDIEESRP